MLALPAALLAVVTACGSGPPGPTPPGASPPPTGTAQPTPSQPPSPTTTALPSPSPRPSLSPTGTALPSPQPTPTPSPTTTPQPTPTLSPTATPQGPYITVGDVTLTVELAVTPLEKQVGLSGRDRLPTYAGMIFLYDEEAQYSFWMRGMLIPLDFLWIGADCTVFEVIADVPPPEKGAPTSSLPLYMPSAPVLHVLEVNAGVVEESGMQPGDRVRFFGEELMGFGC